MTETERNLMITRNLMNFGVPAKLRGFCLIRDAMWLCLADFKGNYDMTNLIYPYLLSKYPGLSTAGVERSIRYAIRAAWEQSDSELVCKVFRYSNHEQPFPPSNREFIATFTEYLRYLPEFSGVAV